MKKKVYYRIYALVLKRLDKVNFLSNQEELKSINSFLEAIIETKFVKIHNDFQFNEIALFLVNLFETKSKKIFVMETNGLVNFL